MVFTEFVIQSPFIKKNAARIASFPTSYLASVAPTGVFTVSKDNFIQCCLLLGVISEQLGRLNSQTDEKPHSMTSKCNWLALTHRMSIWCMMTCVLWCKMHGAPQSLMPGAPSCMMHGAPQCMVSSAQEGGTNWKTDGQNCLESQKPTQETRIGTLLGQNQHRFL